MAKDDYDRLVCLILTYLYSKLRGKIEEKPEQYLQPMTKDFPISEEYFFFVLESLLKEGYIDGITIHKAWGGDTVSISGISRIRITADGIHYLCENSTMRRVLEWLRDHSVPLTGMVSTAIDILS